MAVDPVPPDVRHRLRRLRLTPRRAGGHGIGTHASRNRGAGHEFAQYRAYEPGDAPRDIDWKLYGRSDRFFVREAERESPFALWLVIDASASMGQADAARPGWSRLAAARALAGCLAELAMAGGDRFGWVAPQSDACDLAMPAGGSRQRDRLWLDLARLEARGTFATGATLAPLWDRIGPDDLIVVLSDLFDDAVVGLALRLAAARREVVAIGILTAEERDFPFAGGRRFVDPETGADERGDAAAMRADFLTRFGAARAALAARLAAGGVRHADLVLDDAVDTPLRALFGSGA